MTDRSPHYRNCNLCEAICGIEISEQPNQILNIRGDKDDRFSRGYICPKAVALQDIHYDPDRLKRPVRRTANGWVEMEWDEAFDEVTRNLKTHQRQAR
jgi:anaerobic selenocysteine-containing dehydrogenase